MLARALEMSKNEIKDNDEKKDNNETEDIDEESLLAKAMEMSMPKKKIQPLFENFKRFSFSQKFPLPKRSDLSGCLMNITKLCDSFLDTNAMLPVATLSAALDWVYPHVEVVGPLLSHTSGDKRTLRGFVCANLEKKESSRYFSYSKLLCVSQKNVGKKVDKIIMRQKSILSSILEPLSVEFSLEKECSILSLIVFTQKT